MSIWPAHFPDDCPPAEARADDVHVFRLVTTIPPSPADFMPTNVEFPHRAFKPEDFCCACGVSVFTNVADVEQRRSDYKPLRTRKIAQGLISTQDGLVLETFRPSHMTWWLQTDTPHVTFTEFEHG